MRSGLGIFAAGCSLAPQFTRPALPVANEYPPDAPIPPGAKPDARAAAEIGWREYFADPQLQAMIAQALEHNRDLRLAALRVLETRAAYQMAEVRRDAAVADYERTVKTASRDVADALSAQHWMAEQVAIQRRALAAQRERARLAQMRYDRGTATFLEVLDAQRDLLSTEQTLVQLRRSLLSSRVSLYAALGGGSQHYGEPPESTARYEAKRGTRASRKSSSATSRNARSKRCCNCSTMRSAAVWPRSSSAW